MSFGVSKPKRLARKNKSTTAFAETAPSADLYITPYTEKSIVVMGDTLGHSNALVQLGGKYNTNLRVGQGWIFAKTREASVQHYIDTGEIKPYVYSQADQAKWKKKSNETPKQDDKQLRTIFQEFRNAFDKNEEYEGSSIIDVIYQLEERYCSKKASPPTKKVKVKKPVKKSESSESVDDSSSSED